MSTVKRNFTAARAACSAGGGELVLLDSPTKQLMVERYFGSRGSLPADLYWHGISRRVPGAEGPRRQRATGGAALHAAAPLM
jgi:hypothetical protein